MARITPIRKWLAQAHADFLPYGPPINPDTPADPRHIELVNSFAELELEYASKRKACVLFDAPHRALLQVTGSERLDFLQRMITQDLRPLAPGACARAFWLNRKGRIDADLRVINLEDRILLTLDAHAARRAHESLSAYVITEDVTITDLTDQRHSLLLLGPTAPDLLRALAQPLSGPHPADLADNHACRATLAGVELLIDRQDLANIPSFECILDSPEHALTLWPALLEAASPYNAAPDGASKPATELAQRIKLRPCGWHALNVARIESGVPLYNIDFGPDSLPHETGVLHDRVSFKKGCYLGQEVVARLEALGKPKQQLVALRIESQPSPEDRHEARLPIAPAQLFAEGDALGDVLGAITSSTLSPMLAGAPIAFAQLRTKHAAPATRLATSAQGVILTATVQPRLQFWPPVTD